MPLSSRQREYLQLMGITVWKERSSESHNSVPAAEVQTADKNLSEQAMVDTGSQQVLETEAVKANKTSIQTVDMLKREDLPENWSQLIDSVAACQRCDLHQTRTQTVFGVGDSQADWMIIGEAPGAEEDRQGEPFVGRAGKLLTTILKSIGLDRDKVYIANTLKCRPPNNRDPKPSEAEQCRAYLDQQITLVNPKIIICVGRIATQNLLATQDPLSRLRGKIHSIIHPSMREKNIPVIATYHPAYLLRSPSQKRKVWDDLKMAFSVLSDTQ